MGTETPAWRALADDIEQKTALGVWACGERLPSLREVKATSGRSMNTVVRAFRELEQRGVIEARDRSGYYITHDLELEPPRATGVITGPAEVEVSSLTETVVTDSLDPSMVPIGASTLDPALLPVRALGRIIRQLTHGDWFAVSNYAPSAGLDSLRKRIAARYLGLIPNITPDNVVVTGGCSEALALALQSLASPPAVVAVESPTHFGTLQMLRDRGYRVVEVPIDPSLGVDPDELSGLFQSRRVDACILTPTAPNPTGAVLSKERARAIARVLAEHGVPAVEDDVYAELVHDGPRGCPIAHWAGETGARIVTCGSYSKVIAPGFRLGWAIAEPALAHAVAQLKAGLSLAAPTLQQHVLARYLAGGDFDRHMVRLRARVKTQIGAFAREIARSFPEGTRLAVPRAANFLWIELPVGTDSVEVHARARDAGIVVVPGPAFSASGGYRNYLRLSAPGPMDDRYRHAITVLGDIVKNARSNDRRP
ncbi:MAG: PLP-dependent aminotransferase family protein [Spirochaetota bacterium]